VGQFTPDSVTGSSVRTAFPLPKQLVQPAITAVVVCVDDMPTFTNHIRTNSLFFLRFAPLARKYFCHPTGTVVGASIVLISSIPVARQNIQRLFPLHLSVRRVPGWVQSDLKLVKESGRPADSRHQPFAAGKRACRRKPPVLLSHTFTPPASTFTTQ